MNVQVFGEEISIKDFNQRYEGSYVLLETNNDRRAKVCFMGHLDTLGSIVITEFGNDLFPRNYFVNNIRIIKEFPEMGLVNWAGNVYIVSRKPLRQWCRGFKFNLIATQCRNIKAPMYREFAFVNTLFLRDWISFKEGIGRLFRKDVSAFAINNTYWFSGTPKHLYVWRNCICLGELVQNRLFSFVDSSDLVAEFNSEKERILNA